MWFFSLSSSYVISDLVTPLWQRSISSHIAFFNTVHAFCLLLLYKMHWSSTPGGKHTLLGSSVCSEQSPLNGLCGGHSFRSHVLQTQRCQVSMASCWSRTCSTAVHRIYGYKPHVGEPNGTSWSGQHSVHLQRKPKTHTVQASCNLLLW